MTQGRKIVDWWDEYFLTHVIKDGPIIPGLFGCCWRWTGFHSKQTGRPHCRIPIMYGMGRTSTQVARMIFIYGEGSVDPLLEADHLCFNVWCVNPNHLELVTKEENARRYSVSVTHCPRDHPYNKKNTYYWKGSKYCRICKLDRDRARYHLKKLAA